MHSVYHTITFYLLHVSCKGLAHAVRFWYFGRSEQEERRSSYSVRSVVPVALTFMLSMQQHITQSWISTSVFKIFMSAEGVGLK